MKTNLNSILVFAGILTLLILILSGFADRNPENVIVGNWEEEDWAYEKIENESLYELGINEIKKHESEKWVFKEDNKLELYKENELLADATWRIKGRGHILKIDYNDGSHELFDIKELNDEEMILNFDIGMETRGIAKLIFTR